MRVFMAEDNICAQNLLKLVSHGNAVIAELLRLKDHIPSVYRCNTKDALNKYQDIIMDFSYFNISDSQEKKISSNPKLQELNDDIKESTLEIVSRVYSSLESIYEYANDLNNFIEQLDENTFIQQSIETVMQDIEGKQLLCESLYLYGCMLLLVDVYVSGPVRERLLVAFYRYSTSQSQSNVDAVCTLLRDTGYSPARRPPCYPVEYFSRVPMKTEFLQTVISKLRSDDIYNQLSVYPLPEQRSTALASQANMLFVCLFFCPQYLHSDTVSMREIVDKFFADNWVISIYMGLTLNVLDFWDGFKAARTALVNNYSSKSVKFISEKCASYVPKLTLKIRNLLKEGTLTDDDILDNSNKIISLLRESNVKLRWLILHTSKTTFPDNCKRSKQLTEVVLKEMDSSCLKLLELLISTAELELKVREMLTLLLKNRNNMWIDFKKQAFDGIAELNELLSESKTANKIPNRDQLKIWFDNIAKQIETLGDTITLKSTKKVVQLTQALDKVVEFHNIRSVPSVLQTFSETQEALKNALRISNLREESLVALETVADVSYAWCSIDIYTQHMQDMIKEKPAVTSRLRALFLKLANAMEIPLLRINQAHSDDLISVSQYYSQELVSYIKKVLQVIPEMVFNILAKIIEVQTWNLKEIPTRLEKDKLREFAQLEDRMEVARLTNSASTFTKGILEMRTTLVGVVCIDPARLLDEGLQRELARHINSKLEQLIETTPNRRAHTAASLLPKLDTLASSMDGYKRSLQYIQDYINIHGLKIWQNQMTSIVEDGVRAETRSRRGALLSAPPVSFMGALARQVARLCDARCSTYMSLRAAWFDSKTHAEVINDKTFNKLNEAIGAVGLHGLDTLYAFMIKNQIQALVETHKSGLTKDKSWSELSRNPGIKNILKDVEIIQQVKPISLIVDMLLSVGTLQMLRKHIAYQLNTSAKFDSVHLEASLTTMNEALINELKLDSKSDGKPRISTELLQILDEHLVRCGQYTPHEKIYIKTSQEPTSPNMSYILALVVLSQLSRLQLCPSSGILVAKKTGDNMDGHALLVGVYTVLRQYQNDYVASFIDHMSDYITQQTSITIRTKQPEVSQDVINLTRWLEQFCHDFKIPFVKIDNNIPLSLLTLPTSAK